MNETVFNSNRTIKRLRIAFISTHDARDKRAWSGTMSYMLKSLETHAGEVVLFGSIAPRRKKLLRGLSLLSKLCFGKVYDSAHSFYLSKGYAKMFRKCLLQNPVDIIFAPVAATEIAFLETSIPIVYLSDATVAVMLGYYPAFSNLWGFSQKQANQIESLAINKSSQLIYSSQWAADSAIRDYGAALKRVHFIPFGANIDEAPSMQEITERSQGECLRLLFIGVDWERKGGAIAYDTLKVLDSMGISTQLTVVGCVPPMEFSHSALKIIPFLNKNNPIDFAKLSKLLLESDIFILPTRAECSAIVFCEAAAYGLPVFTSATGGTSSLIENGVTGQLFSLEAKGCDYASAIAELWHNPDRIKAMSIASRLRYDSLLNWDAWGKSVADIIHLATGSTHKRADE